MGQMLAIQCFPNSKAIQGTTADPNQVPTTFMAMAMPDPPKATTRSRTPMSKTLASNASLGSPRTSAQGASPYSSPSCSANSSCTPSDTDSSAARPSSTSSSLGEGAPPKLYTTAMRTGHGNAVLENAVARKHQPQTPHQQNTRTQTSKGNAMFGNALACRPARPPQTGHPD